MAQSVPVRDTIVTLACDSFELPNGEWTKHNMVWQCDTVFDSDHNPIKIYADSVAIGHPNTVTLHQPEYYQDSAFYNNVWYFQTVIVPKHDKNIYGCDSTTWVTLFVDHIGRDTTYHCDYVPYYDEDDNAWYNESYSKTRVIHRPGRMDSIVVDSIMLYEEVVARSVGGRDSLYYDGTWYKESCVIGYDSLSEHCQEFRGAKVWLSIDICHQVTYKDSIDYFSACDSVFYQGRWYSQSTSVRDTVYLTYKMDSIHIDSINVIGPAYHELEITGIDSVLYDGVWYYENESFVEKQIEPSQVTGCDSIQTIQIIVQKSIPIPPPSPVEPFIDNLIINKYNWILLANNAILHRLYPYNEPDEYYWLHNDKHVESVQGDYYTEDHVLVGKFQLLVRYGRNWHYSNVITIGDQYQITQAQITPNPVPAGMKAEVILPGDFKYSIYNQNGALQYTGEATDRDTLPQLPSGIYIVLILNDQGIQSIKLIVE